MGRELDASLAEMLGYEVEWVEGIEGYAAGTGDIFTIKEPAIREGGCIFYLDIDNDIVLNSVSRYSTDGNAMLELDAEMEKQGYYLGVVNPHIINKSSGKVVVFAAVYLSLENLEKYRFEEDGVETQFGKTKNEPLARALAAYKALTGKEWQE